jgi:hypothetical protein
MMPSIFLAFGLGVNIFRTLYGQVIPNIANLNPWVLLDLITRDNCSDFDCFFKKFTSDSFKAYIYLSIDNFAPCIISSYSSKQDIQMEFPLSLQAVFQFF